MLRASRVSDHYANEARRLLKDEVLKKAFEEVRKGALEALAVADADDKTKVLRLQQKVIAIENIRAELEAMILSQGEGMEAPA